MTYVYFIATKRKNAVKIGVAKNPDKRLKTFQTANYQELIILRVIKVANRDLAFKLEKALHQKFKKYHIRGEWFKLTPTVIKFIKNYQTNNVSLFEEVLLYLRNTTFFLALLLIVLLILK